MDRAKYHARRAVIAVVGSLVLVVGIVAIPYPGPGWLIVFAGLAILATEFDWARRMLERARSEYDRWRQWLRHQNMIIRLVVLASTCTVVVMTLWLLNIFGNIDDFLRLQLRWLHSPFMP